MVPAEPGSVPIADALDTLGEPPLGSGWPASADFRWFISRVSAGCMRPAPT